MNDRPPRPGAYLTVDSPYEVERWRPLANFVLAFPHVLIAASLGRLAQLTFCVYWVAFVFTGKLDDGLYGLMTMSERYNTRASGFLVGWSGSYPPFDFTPGPGDNGAYPPIALDLPLLPDPPPRAAALNVVKAIPLYVVVFVYAIAAIAVAIAAWLVVLFTGAWPRPLRDFAVRVANTYYRVWSYVTMVDNDYPPFGLATTSAAPAIG